jgi:hypothetical protein
MYDVLGEPGLTNSESFVDNKHEHRARPTGVVLRDGARCSAMVRIVKSHGDTQGPCGLIDIPKRESILG